MKTSAIIAIVVSLVLSAFGQQPNRPRQPIAHNHDLTIDQVRVNVNNQLMEANRHHDRVMIGACTEAIDVIDGRRHSLTSGASRCLIDARQRFHTRGLVPNVQTWDFVLNRCGVAPIYVGAPIASGGYSHVEHRSSYAGVSHATFHASQTYSGPVDRCSYLIQRGSRSGQVCGLPKVAHKNFGGVLLCPDELCAKCGRHAVKHHWLEGNGLLCHVHTDQITVVVGNAISADGAIMPPPSLGAPLPQPAPRPPQVAPQPPVRKFEIPKLKPTPAPDAKKVVPVQPAPRSGKEPIDNLMPPKGNKDGGGAGTEVQPVQPRRTELEFSGKKNEA